MRRILAILMFTAVVAGGCSPTPKYAENRTVKEAEVKEAITLMKANDPGIQRFFDRSAGWAVIPKIFKGAFVLGGAYGNGIVYENGLATGYTSLSQATVGFSFGGEFYREIIFFRDRVDLDRFRAGRFTFAAQALAVAVKAGAAAKADYKDEMAVFVMSDVGLMVDASIGGQEFKYEPIIRSGRQ